MFNLKSPQNIFVHADGFQKAVRYLNKPPESGLFDPFCFAAMITNSAFASELYLKCLIQIETQQVIRAEHDLKKLFSRLPAATQEEIEKPFNAEMSKAVSYDLSRVSKEEAEVIAKKSRNFREALAKGRDAFVKWRYLYEDENIFRSYDLFGLPPILRGVILARRPEWGNFRINMTKLAGPLPTSQVPKTPGQGA